MQLVLFFLCLLLSGCQDNLTINQIEYNKTETYKILIEGHVNKPGLHTIEKKDNVSKLIVKAGGYKKNAQVLNSKTKLYDNQKIFINSTKIANKLNINTATDTQLTEIKGIGPARAKKIIEYRAKHGDFKSITELKEIKGIKDKLFNKIYEYIKV